MQGKPPPSNGTAFVPIDMNRAKGCNPQIPDGCVLLLDRTPTLADDETYMEWLSALVSFIKSLFSSVTVNVNVGGVEGMRKTVDPPPKEALIEEKVAPLQTPILLPRPKAHTETGAVNPIDEEAISDLLTNLKYAKRPGDKIEIKLGNTKLNPDDL